MLALIGFMGSGKTTMSKLLSARLNVNVISLDDEIEKRLNIKISNIFQKFGEEFFREKESEILLEICENKNVILDLGGGTFINDKNRDTLKNVRTIFLNVPFNVICKRLENDRANRPLLNNKDWKQKANELYNSRMDFYKKADIIVDINEDSPEDVLKKILGKI